MKKYLIFSTVLITAGVTIPGCFAPQETAQTKQTFTFNYTPKETNRSGSANMLLAFVKPHYAYGFTAGSGELFQRFRNALGNDIEQIIIAKGFTLKGPFAGFDEMIYDDKRNVEMIVNIEIAPSFTAQEGGWKMNVSLLGSQYNSYSYYGKASLVGKINLSGIEPLTNQKIWSKSVQIPNIENIPIQTSVKYTRQLTASELLDDPGVYNALGKALLQQYEGIMDKITAHFSVDEFNSLKPQVKELKSKKGF